MRVGDFGVEVIALENGEAREIESGHVLARAGTVYGIRLRNFGPLRCVADVHVDGKPMTGRGLVIDAYGSVTLERPVDGRDAGRFTVIAEGDERVFGPDGGRDNPDLGCIDVRFRRELPRGTTRRTPDLSDEPTLPLPTRAPRDPFEPQIPLPPTRPMAPPEWTPPGFHASAARPRDISAMLSRHAVTAPELPSVVRDETSLIERAAGTGLTGHSTQEFVPIAIGPLEQEATVIRLRIVIGSDEAFTTPRPLVEPDRAPARPPARP
jgi:hypothetical protein